MKLHTPGSITTTSIKKIQSCFKSNTIVIITASWCGHCENFAPEKKKFLEGAHLYNIIDINDVALHELKSRDCPTWKNIVPDDHRVYFPMIIAVIPMGSIKGQERVARQEQAALRVRKKVYNGPRTNREIREYIRKII